MKNWLLLFLFTSLLVSSVFAVTEGLTKEQIQQAIRKNIKNVIKCYEDELASKPHLKGRVQLSFNIESDGKIINSSVAKTTLNNQVVETCIVEVSKTWTFRMPTGNKSVHVEYPFEFEPSKK